MRLALVLVAALLGQEDTGAQYYKFKKDTKWTYDQTKGDEKSLVVFIWLKEESGKVHVDSKEFKVGSKDPFSSETVAWWVEDGHLIWGVINKGEVQPMFRVYKLGAKKGDTWDGVAMDIGQKVTATHEGTMEVKVPAGTYKDTIHVKMNLGDKGTMSFYFAPKVGLVKLEADQGKEKMQIELKEMGEGP